MPTVNSIVSQASSVANLSTQLFRGNRAAANQSVLVAPGYNNFLNFLRSDFGGQPAITNLIKNYTDNRESFNDEMQENLNSLKESSDRVKESATAETETPETAEIADADNDNNTGAALSTLGEFAIGNIPPEQRNIPQPQTDTRPEPPAPKTNSLQEFANTYLTAEKIKSDAISTLQNPNDHSRVAELQNLVRDFNSAITYLYENRGVSNLMSALADKFGNNRDLTDSLNSIGISVDARGFLSVNEAIFNSALDNNSDSVNSILGSNGLAGQLDRNINLANYQGDRLFTSIMDYANQQRQDESESLYSNNAAYARENTPRIFAMLT